MNECKREVLGNKTRIAFFVFYTRNTFCLNAESKAVWMSTFEVIWGKKNDGRVFDQDMFLNPVSMNIKEKYMYWGIKQG